MHLKQTNLEVDEETVQLPLAGAAVEVLAARVEQRADHPEPEQVLGRIQEAGAAVRVHPEEDEGEEGAENDGRLHHAVVIELAQELGAADAPLVELGLVDLGVDGGGRGVQILCWSKSSHTRLYNYTTSSGPVV